MANKRFSTPRRVSASKEQARPLLERWLLVLTLVPLAAGVIVILSGLAGILFFASRTAHIVWGGLGILLSFALSNAVQKQWSLAAGWLLLALAIGLIFSRSESWLQVPAFLLGGVALYLLLSEMVTRGWERQARAKKK